MDVDTESYQTPQVTDLGDVTELTLGTAADDTADMNTARYY
ncbi:lasso RiPP family leader peptide-containing protein [Kutzneria sp. NPDC051319]